MEDKQDSPRQTNLSRCSIHVKRMDRWTLVSSVFLQSCALQIYQRSNGPTRRLSISIPLQTSPPRPCPLSTSHSRVNQKKAQKPRAKRKSHQPLFLNVLPVPPVPAVAAPGARFSFLAAAPFLLPTPAAAAVFAAAAETADCFAVAAAAGRPGPFFTTGAGAGAWFWEAEEDFTIVVPVLPALLLVVAVLVRLTGRLLFACCCCARLGAREPGPPATVVVVGLVGLRNLDASFSPVGLMGDLGKVRELCERGERMPGGAGTLREAVREAGFGFAVVAAVLVRFLGLGRSLGGSSAFSLSSPVEMWSLCRLSALCPNFHAICFAMLGRRLPLSLQALSKWGFRRDDRGLRRLGVGCRHGRCWLRLLPLSVFV